MLIIITDLFVIANLSYYLLYVANMAGVCFGTIVPFYTLLCFLCSSMFYVLHLFVSLCLCLSTPLAYVSVYLLLSLLQFPFSLFFKGRKRPAIWGNKAKRT